MPRKPVAEAERCESVNVSTIRQKQCGQRAVATVTHPDLGKAYRVCKTHMKDYNSAVQMATGWRVTKDSDDDGAR